MRNLVQVLVLLLAGAALVVSTVRLMKMRGEVGLPWRRAKLTLVAVICGSLMLIVPMIVRSGGGTLAGVGIAGMAVVLLILEHKLR